MLCNCYCWKQNAYYHHCILLLHTFWKPSLHNAVVFLITTIIIHTALSISLISWLHHSWAPLSSLKVCWWWILPASNNSFQIKMSCWFAAMLSVHHCCNAYTVARTYFSIKFKAGGGACEPSGIFCINVAKNTFRFLSILKVDEEDPLKLMNHKNFWSFVRGRKICDFFFLSVLGVLD